MCDIIVVFIVYISKIYVFIYFFFKTADITSQGRKRRRLSLKTGTQQFIPPPNLLVDDDDTPMGSQGTSTLSSSLSSSFSSTLGSFTPRYSGRRRRNPTVDVASQVIGAAIKQLKANQIANADQKVLVSAIQKVLQSKNGKLRSRKKYIRKLRRRSRYSRRRYRRGYGGPKINITKA